MPRGGKRPGAGAKPGNINAYRHGGYSQQVRALAEAFSRVPDLRDALAAAGRVRRRQEREARRVAITLLYHLMQGTPPPKALLRRAGNDQTAFNVFMSGFVSAAGKEIRERSNNLSAAGKPSKTLLRTLPDSQDGHETVSLPASEAVTPEQDGNAHG